MIEIEFRFVGSGEERFTDEVIIKRVKLVRILLECAEALRRSGDYEGAKHYEHLAETARKARRMILRVCDVGACISDVPIALRDLIIDRADEII